MTAAPAIGLDYQPAATGPFLWQAFDAGAVAADLAAIARTGFREIRVGLAWDSFMPDARGVDPRRLGQLDTLLNQALAHSIRVIPVLFVQCHGDCVFLPRATVRRDRVRRGVRVLSDGFVEPGGPRDVWADPLMTELADRWSRTMAEQFAGHPAIAAWDLGDDPAGAVRPRRAADLAAWVALAGAPLRERGDRVHLTVGAGDVLHARGVRLAALAPHLDRIDIAVRTAQLRDVGLAHESAIRFIAQLAQALAGDTGTPVGMAVAMPSSRDDTQSSDEADTVATAEQLIARRASAGIRQLRATRWSDLHPRLEARAPFDRAGWLLRSGLVRSGGSVKPALEVWSRAARDDAGDAAAHPWPPHIDVDAFYADLPGGLLDLVSAWHRAQDDQPAILENGEH